MAQNASTLVPKGAFLMGILVEGKTPNDPATHGNLDSWIKSTKTPHTWTLDAAAPQTDMETYFGKQRDTWVLVDLKTMKIVDIIDGDAQAAVDELTKLLDGK